MVVLPPPPEVAQNSKLQHGAKPSSPYRFRSFRNFFGLQVADPPYTLVHVDLWSLGNDPHPTPCPKDYIRSRFVSSRVLLRLKGAARNSLG